MAIRKELGCLWELGTGIGMYLKCLDGFVLATHYAYLDLIITGLELNRRRSLVIITSLGLLVYKLTLDDAGVSFWEVTGDITLQGVVQ